MPIIAEAVGQSVPAAAVTLIRKEIVMARVAREMVQKAASTSIS